jgi:hypothetical protein
MKKIIVISALAILFSCNNNNESKTDSEGTNTATDSLATNPHAVPTHVDTIAHENSLSDESSIADTTKERDDTKFKRNDSLREK